MKADTKSKIENLEEEIKLLELEKRKQQLQKEQAGNKKKNSTLTIFIIIIIIAFPIIATGAIAAFTWVQDKANESVAADEEEKSTETEPQPEESYETKSARCAGKGIQEMSTTELENKIYQSCMSQSVELETYIACTEDRVPDLSKDIDKENESLLCRSTCEYTAGFWYKAYWNDRCREQGKLNNCLLEDDTANAINERYEEFKQYCQSKKFEL